MVDIAKHITKFIPILEEKYYLSSVLVILIFFVGFFIRFYHLSDIPSGLYPDETAIGYNAYSILLTGKDEYGVPHPLYFRSYDDYKMPVYIYATALSIKLFGVNAFAVRFTSALFGSFTIIALYFLVLRLSKNKRFAMFSALLLTFNPWHIFFSRVGYEVNVATSLLVIGMLFFVLAVQKKNNFFLFFFSIIALLISLYTYNVTRLISPLLFLSLIIFYYKQITHTSKKLLVSLCLLFFLGMLPFLVTLVSFQSLPGFSAQQDALITGKIEKATILQTRSYFVTLPVFMQKIFLNYWVLLIWGLFNNLFSFLSTSFFFSNGAVHPYESIQGFGMFYYFDLPFIIIGLYQGIKKKMAYFYPFYVWTLLVLFIGTLAVPFLDTYGTKTYEIVIPLIVFSAIGFSAFLDYIKQIKNQPMFFIINIVSIIFIVFSFMFYIASYFIRFPIEDAKEWGAQDQKAVAYIKSIEENYNTIIFDQSSHFQYTALLFYGKYSPSLHQQQAIYVPNGLVDTVISDGKYQFRKVDWNKDFAHPGTLIITGGDNVPENIKPIAVFSYPTRPVVLYYDRQIAQYPVTQVAYEIFQSPTSH